MFNCTSHATFVVAETLLGMLFGMDGMSNGVLLQDQRGQHLRAELEFEVWQQREQYKVKHLCKGERAIGFNSQEQAAEKIIIVLEHPLADFSAKYDLTAMVTTSWQGRQAPVFRR
jgi:hypothetical protein